MIRKQTLSFLRALAINNNREWFAANRHKYESAKDDFNNCLKQTLTELTKYDTALKNLEPKDCVFRIYRDIRFSPDKTPYRTNLGAAINAGGKKIETAGAYLHIQPGNKSFFAGGRWMPDKETLRKIRQEIDYNSKEFKAILNEKEFKKYFGALENIALKKAPKDYPKNHPEIALLKYTSYIASMPLSDSLITSAKGVKEMGKAYKALLPLLKFLNRALD